MLKTHSVFPGERQGVILSTRRIGCSKTPREGSTIRYNRRQEELRQNVLAWAVLGVLLAILAAVIHLLYHQEFADADIPNDCFAVAAATGETAVPKLVCLTFDDGPSPNTQPILEILAQEKVPATFFVCAQDINREYLPLVRTIAQQGHQVAMHSATHRYAKIYQSPDAFWQDIKTLRQALEPYISLDTLTWLRFPGGSTNTVSHKYGGSSIMKELKAQTEEKGWHWIDWNVCAEDATAAHPDADGILRNIQEDARDLSTCVVLLHDTKATGQTVQALPQIIGWFREEGYTFCTVEQLAELQTTGE